MFLLCLLLWILGNLLGYTHACFTLKLWMFAAVAGGVWRNPWKRLSWGHCLGWHLAARWILWVLTYVRSVHYIKTSRCGHQSDFLTKIRHKRTKNISSVHWGYLITMLQAEFGLILGVHPRYNCAIYMCVLIAHVDKKENVAWLWQATPVVQKQAHATLRTPRYVATSRTTAVLTSLTGCGKPGVLEQAAPGPPMTTLTEQVKVKSWVKTVEGRNWQVREARWTGTSSAGSSSDHTYGTSQGKVQS